jgi:type II secretory pathway pseudopilin PulG
MRARGFTLLELMNFLALAGILSAIGMYALARYVRHAKTAEAVGSVSSIAAESASYYNASDATQPAGSTPEAVHAMRHFPPASTHSVPANADDVKGKKYQSAIADWNVSPWRELRFSISLPQYYAYSYESTGTGATAKAVAVAHGDLDGDGNGSTYRLTIAPDGAFTAQVSPSMDKIDAEE